MESPIFSNPGRNGRSGPDYWVVCARASVDASESTPPATTARTTAGIPPFTASPPRRIKFPRGGSAPSDRNEGGLT